MNPAASVEAETAASVVTSAAETPKAQSWAGGVGDLDLPLVAAVATEGSNTTRQMNKEVGGKKRVHDAHSSRESDALCRVWTR